MLGAIITPASSTCTAQQSRQRSGRRLFPPRGRSRSGSPAPMAPCRSPAFSRHSAHRGDRQTAISAARDYALRGIDLDPLDPSYNLAGPIGWRVPRERVRVNRPQPSARISPTASMRAAGPGGGRQCGVAGDVTRAIELDPFLYAMQKGLAHLHRRSGTGGRLGGARAQAGRSLPDQGDLGRGLPDRRDTSRAVYWKDQTWQPWPRSRRLRGLSTRTSGKDARKCWASDFET